MIRLLVRLRAHVLSCPRGPRCVVEKRASEAGNGGSPIGWLEVARATIRSFSMWAGLRASWLASVFACLRVCLRIPFVAAVFAYALFRLSRMCSLLLA